MIQETTQNPEVSETPKEPVIGKFKPKRKFLSFVTASAGAIGNHSNGIRFIGDSAFIKSEQLTGTLEGVIFKIEICDEGTINFEETDTKLCSDDMIQRFIDYIDTLDVTGYAEKFVVHGVDFLDKDNRRIYHLEVEYKKPFDQLQSLFDDLKEPEIEATLNEGGMSILDSLFGDDKTEEPEHKVGENSLELTEVTKPEHTLSAAEVIEDILPKETYAQQMMREAFESMNAEKVAELKDRIEKKERNISKYRTDIRQAEANLRGDTDELRVLSTRLETLTPAEDPNEFVFHVSVEKKTGIEADETLKDVVNKISPILKLRAEAVIDMLTNGFYTIKLGEKADVTKTEIDLSKEVYSKLMKLDITGKMTMISSNEFEYRGELNWHQLVSKMLRAGFEQDSEFDKLVDSNSYKSEYKEGTEEDGCTDCNCGTGTACGDDCKHDHSHNHSHNGGFVLTDGNGNVLPDETEKNTNIAHAIANAFGSQENENPDTNKDPNRHEICESIAKCEFPNLTKTTDPRVAVINHLGTKYIQDGKTTVYDLAGDIKGMVDNWPEVSELENDDFEDLDMENCDITVINDNKIVICAGGDWQTPLRVTIQADENGKLHVTDLSEGMGSGMKDADVKEQLSVAVIRDKKIDQIVKADNLIDSIAKKEVEYGNAYEEDPEYISSEFEETNGYPMGDEFIFSILDMTKPGFGHPDPDQTYCLAIQPKSYWDNEQCQYDQEMCHYYQGKFPTLAELEEPTEGTFLLCLPGTYASMNSFPGNGTYDINANHYVSLTDAIVELCKAGIKPCISFQNFMEASDLQLLIDTVTNAGFKNLIVQ